MRTLVVCTLVVLVAGCSSSTSPLQPAARSFYIAVNPAVPIAGRNARYTMYAADDTSFVAYHYLWDFDERNTLPHRDTKNPYRIFDDTLVHHISCFAQDSFDHTIGEAHLRIQCQPPHGSVSVTATHDSVEWQILDLHVSGAPRYYSLIYEWDFGDGSTGTFYDSTAVHHYPHSGQYTVRVRILEGAFAFATDSAVVNVASPLVSSSDLSSMHTLTAYYSDPTTNQFWELFELPLQNSGEYTYVGPPNFDAEWQHTSHQTNADSASVRSMRGALNANGLEINAFLLYSFDTAHTISSVEKLHSTIEVATADTLLVRYKTQDSIAFASAPVISIHMVQSDSTILHPTGACDGIGSLQLEPPATTWTPGSATLLLVWRK